MADAVGGAVELSVDLHEGVEDRLELLGRDVQPASGHAAVGFAKGDQTFFGLRLHGGDDVRGS